MIELRRFFTKECLNRQEQWNYILNTYLQYIKEKKKTKYQPKGKDFIQLELALKIKQVALKKKDENSNT